MGLRATVAGASGYAGGELLRLLLQHPHLEVVGAAAGSQAGRPITEVHPHLVPLSGWRFAATQADVLSDADVVFLALPHGESAALAEHLSAEQLVVDLAADFRLANPDDWQRFYGGTHAGTWTYGLPELAGARDEISAARRIAAPGCYPTAVTLALAPLLSAGLVQPNDLVIVAASGTSGAGRAPKASLLASEVLGSVRAYSVGGVHRHTPEITQNLTRAAGTPVSVSFTPVLAPMPRGILATCTARVEPEVGAEDLADALADAYAAEPFVHLLPDGEWPTTAATLGSNSIHLQVALDEDAGRAIVVAAEDNLVKGAAGQAIQAANLALGLDETAGLPVSGLAP